MPSVSISAGLGLIAAGDKRDTLVARRCACLSSLVLTMPNSPSQQGDH